jgi:4-alpha-glucanotransferase
LGRLPFVAEDLGVITDDVRSLRRALDLPGMRVLQFGFDQDGGEHAPSRLTKDVVVYTGTHDNDTTRGWFEMRTEHERSVFWSYVQRAPGDAREAVWEMIRLALASSAALAVVPLQDVLGLGSRARMNIPGLGEGQWRWRTTEQSLDDVGWQRLAELTQVAGRYPERGDLSRTIASK